MNHNLNVIVELEPDDLEQVAAEIRSDGEHSRGSLSGSRLTTTTQLAMACSMDESSTPCFRADRWISTFESYYVIPRYSTSRRADRRVDLCGRTRCRAQGFPARPC
jgi:hypothetical protein